MGRPKNLTSLSLEALVKMRDDVSVAIATQAAALRAQLARLTSDAPRRSRPVKAVGKSKLAAPKVAPKYRDTSGNTWSGRGVQPRWMSAAIKEGAKRDDFLIAKPAKAAWRKARR
jgi:DNA-binding protein H-NS